MEYQNEMLNLGIFSSKNVAQLPLNSPRSFLHLDQLWNFIYVGRKYNYETMLTCTHSDIPFSPSENAFSLVLLVELYRKRRPNGREFYLVFEVCEISLWATNNTNDSKVYIVNATTKDIHGISSLVRILTICINPANDYWNFVYGKCDYWSNKIFAPSNANNTCCSYYKCSFWPSFFFRKMNMEIE